jgi:hypothetical protein
MTWAAHIAGLVAERGNIAGNAATPFREFKVPSVLPMPGIFDRIKSGESINLEAVHHIHRSRTLLPTVPVSLFVLDLGVGLASNRTTLPRNPRLTSW